ncbi:MAG: PAS domain-containing protein, partial [Geopsychrobacter sp.]|nr:PAS domain-containing protein [Geopsychrobacter sp.]
MSWKNKKTTHEKIASFRGWPFGSLVLPFILIVTLAILGTSLITYKAQGTSLKKSILELEKVRAHNYRDIIQNHLQNKLEALLTQGRILARDYNNRQLILNILQHKKQSEADERLRLQLNRNNYDFELPTITVIDQQANQVFNYGRKSLLSLNDPDIAASLKGLDYSDIVLDGNSWILRVTVPILAKGQTSGVLVLTLELNQILNKLAHEHQLKMVLADNNGIQSLGDAALDSFPINKQWVKTILSGDPMQSIIYQEQQTLFHYMKVRVGNHRFVLISGTDLGPSEKVFKQQQQESLRLSLLLLLGFLPLCAWVVHLLLRPLITLRKRVTKIAENLSNVPLKSYQGNPINRLVHTFEEMATALEEHEKARQHAEAVLQQEHATLEVKIIERTSELEKSNKLLQREISERTLAQQKAEGLQSFLANLINSMPSLLIGVDHEGLINQWNFEAEKLSGLNYAQVSGRPFAEVLPWLDQLRSKIEKTLQQGTPDKIHHLQWSAHNHVRTVDVMIYPIASIPQGGAVIRIDDVTERNRLDELIVQTEKMMSVGGLAAGMAHEINNPLASIIQSAQVIYQRISPELPKNRRCAEQIGINFETINRYLNERQIPKMLTSILDSGQRAGEIVKNMLSFTQQDDSVRAISKISDLLDRAVNHAHQDYDLKKHHNIGQIKIIRNYDNSLPKIMCNASQ